MKEGAEAESTGAPPAVTPLMDLPPPPLMSEGDGGKEQQKPPPTERK